MTRLRRRVHRAGESLLLSQSAVSQHVRRLEKAMGRALVRPPTWPGCCTPRAAVSAEQLYLRARRGADPRLLDAVVAALTPVLAAA